MLRVLHNRRVVIGFDSSHVPHFADWMMMMMMIGTAHVEKKRDRQRQEEGEDKGCGID